MDTSKLQRQCDEHNQQFRQVRYQRRLFIPDLFKSSRENLLITGGKAETRGKIIRSFIVSSKEQSVKPLIIFGERKPMVEDLISMANSCEIGELFVISDEYNNYDFFYGMPDNLILDFFADLAKAQGFVDVSELINYIGAFLNILKTQSEVRLASMLAFSDNTDRDISSLGERLGLYNDYDMVTSSTRGGVSFRRLLAMFFGGVGNLTSRDCDTKFNIGAVANNDCVLYIDTNSRNHKLMSLYFKYALQNIQTKSFTVLFDECNLLSNKDFKECVNSLKLKYSIGIAVSHENIVALIGEDSLTNFNSQIVLLRGCTPTRDIQAVLNKIGEYTHFEITTSKATPPKLFFTLMTSENANITSYTRARVLVEEECQNEAVIMREEKIIVVRELTDEKPSGLFNFLLG